MANEDKSCLDLKIEHQEAAGFAYFKLYNAY